MVLGHAAALKSYTGPGTTWGNKMKFGMHHVPNVDRSLDLLTCSPACYYCAPQPLPRIAAITVIGKHSKWESMAQ